MGDFIPTVNTWVNIKIQTKILDSISCLKFYQLAFHLETIGKKKNPKHSPYFFPATFFYVGSKTYTVVIKNQVIKSYKQSGNRHVNKWRFLFPSLGFSQHFETLMCILWYLALYYIYMFMLSPPVNAGYLESRELALQSPFKTSEAPHGQCSPVLAVLNLTVTLHTYLSRLFE